MNDHVEAAPGNLGSLRSGKLREISWSSQRSTSIVLKKVAYLHRRLIHDVRLDDMQITPPRLLEVLDVRRPLTVSDCHDDSVLGVGGLPKSTKDELQRTLPWAASSTYQLASQLEADTASSTNESERGHCSEEVG